MEKHYLSKTNLIIRMVAGGYLVYLAFQLVTTLEEQTIPPLVSIGCALLFAVAGGVILFFSFKALKNKEYKEALGEPGSEESAEEAQENTENTENTMQ